MRLKFWWQNIYFLTTVDIYGRVYAQLDQPQKNRFEINAVEVCGLLFKEANEQNIV